MRSVSVNHASGELTMFGGNRSRKVALSGVW
jgi:hypothetical protein